MCLNHKKIKLELMFLKRLKMRKRLLQLDISIGNLLYVDDRKEFNKLLEKYKVILN